MSNITGYNLRLKTSTFRKLRYIANKNRRSLNMQLTLIVEELIHNYEKVNGKITEEELMSIEYEKAKF